MAKLEEWISTRVATRRIVDSGMRSVEEIEKSIVMFDKTLLEHSQQALVRIYVYFAVGCLYVHAYMCTYIYVVYIRICCGLSSVRIYVNTYIFDFLQSTVYGSTPHSSLLLRNRFRL